MPAQPPPYPQPPGYGPPPYGPPYGPPAGAPKPKGRRGRILLLVGGGIAVVLAIAVALVVVLWPKDAVGAAATELTSGAVNLSNLPATRFEGTLTDARGSQYTLNIQVTSRGAMSGTMQQGIEQVQVFAVEGQLFLKASEGFWRASGTLSDSTAKYAGQWVRVPPDKFGFDFLAALNPGKLSEQVSADALARRVRPGPESTVNGVRVRQIGTPTGTVYVTVASPQRIVRIESPGSGLAPGPTNLRRSSISGLVRRPALANLAAAGKFQLNLTGLSAAEAQQFVRKLQDSVRDLKNSVDSLVQFTLTGSGNLSPCTNFGCTANVRISNLVTSRSPYLQVKQDITADVTITFQLDGRPAGSCARTVTMAPNGNQQVSCGVTYHARTDQNHRVTAQARAVARAVVEGDIQRMATDLLTDYKAKNFKAGPIPKHAQDTLDHIKSHNGAPPPGYKGNKQYSNTPQKGEQELPKIGADGKPITYKEYDVRPNLPGQDRGTERLVIGSDGSVYYTDDHYQWFYRVK